MGDGDGEGGAFLMSGGSNRRKDRMSTTSRAWLSGKVPAGFWDVRQHRVAYMQWLGEQLGFKKPSDWYSLKRRHFRENRGGGLLVLAYGDSPLQALRDFMPDAQWHPWLLASTPQRFWADPANRRAYMRWLGRRLGIERPEQWYGVKQEDFLRNSGGGLLANYYGHSPIAALKEYLPRRRWQPWRFTSVPQHFWQDPDNRRRYLDWLARRLRIRTPDQWYGVTVEQIADHHGVTLVAHFRWSMLNIVKEYLPDYDWKPWLFRRVPSHYWQNHVNRHRYRDWLAENNGGKP